MDLVLVDDCACPASIAPYIHLVLKHAGQVAQSIYRGDDAQKLLNSRHPPKHTQRQIHADPQYASISNPPGQSMHELFSDGHAKAGPVGRKLQEWEVGVDSGTNDEASKKRIEDAAHHYGWVAYHPYTRGVEGHHWGFKVRPAPNAHVTAKQISQIRSTFPTH